MTCQLINKLKVTSIMLVTLFFCNTNAQEAEKLFHTEYSKISFVYQPSYLIKSWGSNNDGSNYPRLKHKESYSNQFGFFYNFAQSGNFNFRTGVIAKEFYPLFDLNITNEDIGLGGNFNLTDVNPANSFIFSIPIKVDYFIPLNQKLNIIVSSGLNLNLNSGGGETLNTQVFVFNDIEEKIIYNSNNTQNQIIFGTEISAGVNYKTKFALLQMEVFYTQNITDYSLTGDYTIFNLENSENKNGSFTTNGNFYGLSLSVTPKKGWLKRKKT